MKKACKTVLLNLFLVLMIVPIQSMFVSRPVRASKQIVRSYKEHNIQYVDSIKDLKLYFEQETKNGLTALFNTTEERDEFMKKMELHDEIIKKYYDPKKDRSVQKNDPLLTPLFCSGVKSRLSRVNMHPDAVTVISADHLTREWSPTSYMVRRKLKHSLREMYPSVAPKELLEDWGERFKGGASFSAIGGVIIKKCSTGKPMFVPPCLIFSSEVNNMHDANADRLPQEMQHIIGASVGQLLMNVPNTSYQLKDQLTNKYRLEKHDIFNDQQIHQASLACDIEDPELAIKNYLYFHRMYPFAGLCSWYAKVLKCHIADSRTSPKKE